MAESLLQTQKWSSAVKAYNKIADVLLETLQDMKHIDDETLEAYRQARNDLTLAHNNLAEWLDTKGQHGCSLWLREEVQ